MRVCAETGCEKTVKSRSMCSMHYEYWRISERGETCTYTGCEGVARTRGWCALHYARWKKHKDPSVVLLHVTPFTGAAEGTRLRIKAYWRVKIPNHPMADKKGWVIEHRMLMYDRFGPGPHPCWCCCEELKWEPFARGASTKGKIVINHLNEDGHDNRMKNLVFSCVECNRKYSQMFQLMDQFGLRKRADTVSTQISIGRRRDRNKT